MWHQHVYHFDGCHAVYGEFCSFLRSFELWNWNMQRGEFAISTQMGNSTRGLERQSDRVFSMLIVGVTAQKMQQLVNRHLRKCESSVPRALSKSRKRTVAEMDHPTNTE